MSTIYRVNKYKKKGFSISNFELMKITLCQSPNLASTYTELLSEMRKVPSDYSMNKLRWYFRNVIFKGLEGVDLHNRLSDKFDIAFLSEELDRFVYHYREVLENDETPSGNFDLDI